MYCLPVLQITESDQILPNLSKSDRTWPDLFLPVTPYGIWLFWEHMTSSDSSQPSVISITLHSSQWLVKFVSSAFREHAHRIALTRSLFFGPKYINYRSAALLCGLPRPRGKLTGLHGLLSSTQRLFANNRKYTHNSTTPNGRLPERPKPI